MKRPLIFRLLPNKAKEILYYHFFKPIPQKWLPLFENVSLKYAPGIKMMLKPSRDFMYEAIVLLGFYERKLSNLVVTHAKRGGFMIDVGANVGYYTLIWLANNLKNYCLSLEPSPVVYKLLDENVTRNRLNERVTIRREAAGNHTGEMAFNAGDDNPNGWGHLIRAGAKDSLRVKVIRLDKLVRNDQVVDFLKVDVEGAELMVFQGCEKLLKKKAIKHIYFEQNAPGATSMGFPIDGAKKYLESFGYKVSFLWGSQSKPIADCWAE